MPNQYLYRIQPTRLEMLVDGGTEAEQAIITRHFTYLERLTQEGTVILAGRTLNTDASSFGIIVFEAENDAQAQSIVDNDPAIQHQVMAAELFPYRVALMRRTNR